MPDEVIKISQMSETTLGTGGFFVIARSGSNYKISEAILVNFINGTTVNFQAVDDRFNIVESRTTTNEEDIADILAELSTLSTTNDNTYLKLSGGTVTGRIKCAISPSEDADLVNKQYVDFLIANGNIIESTTDVPEGNNLYFTYDRVMSIFNTLTTDDIPEGNVNKYFNATNIGAIIQGYLADYLPLAGGELTGKLSIRKSRDGNFFEIIDENSKILIVFNQNGQIESYGTPNESPNASGAFNAYRNGHIRMRMNSINGNYQIELYDSSDADTDPKTILNSNGESLFKGGDIRLGAGLVFNSVTLSETLLDGKIERSLLDGELYFVNGATRAKLGYQDLSGLVPYTGATADVDLNAKILSNVKNINFTNNITFTDEQKELMPIGTIFYDPDARSLVQKTGMDTFQTLDSEISPTCKNGDSFTHLNGQPVYISSGTGKKPVVKLASATAENQSYTIGLATEDVLHTGNALGKYTVFGTVNTVPYANIIKTGEDEALWVEGSNLYLCSELGKLSTIKETALSHSNQVGTITDRSGANVTIFVRPENGYELNELHDINTDLEVTTPVDADFTIIKENSSGIFKKFSWANIKTALSSVFIPRTQNLLTKEPTGFSRNDSLVITANGDRTITLSGMVSASYRGDAVTEIVNGYISPQHGTDTTKLYYLYYNGSTISWSDTQFTFDLLQICIAKYDNTNARWYYFREAHGFMPWQDHFEFHNNIGTYKSSGGLIPTSSYVLRSTVASQRRIDVNEALIYDEDLPSVIPALTSKSYTQFALTGAGIDNIGLAKTDIINLSTNNPYYNKFTTSWVNTLVPANSVFTVWDYVLPVTADPTSQEYRHLFVQPQWVTQASNPSAGAIATAVTAEKNRLPSELNLNGLLSTEIVAINRITLSYHSGNWRIESVDVLSGNKYSQIGSPSGNYLNSGHYPWASSLHTGTANKIAGFGASGEAVEINDPTTVADEALELAEAAMAMSNPSSGGLTESQVTELINNSLYANAVLSANRPYNGKKLVTLGDSMTYNDLYQFFVALWNGFVYSSDETKNGVDGHAKMGWSGSKIIPSVTDDPIAHPGSASGASIYKRADDVHFYSPDVIILWGSQNDNIVSGSISDAPYTGDEIPFGGSLPSLYSAYKGTLLKLLSQNQGAKIITLTLMHQYDRRHSTMAEYLADEEHRRLLSVMIQECSEYYSVPCVDLWNESGVNFFNQDVYYPTTYDENPHFNEVGAKRIAELIQTKL